MGIFILKPITETSWILTENGDRVGLVSLLENKNYLVLRKTAEEVRSIEDLSKLLGSEVKIEEIDRNVTIEDVPESEVNGYPIKHTLIFNVETVNGITKYTRTQKSNKFFAAGFYGIKYGNNWVISLSPKLETLVQDEYIGPCKTRIEAATLIGSIQRAKV